MGIGAQYIQEFVTSNRLGDWASIFGLFVSVVGFGLTIYKIARTKKEVSKIKQKLFSVDIFSLISSVLTLLEGLKENHRDEKWERAVEKCSSVKRYLSQIRGCINLDDLRKEEIQNAIAHFSGMEQQLERVLLKKTSPNIAKMNEVTSLQIEILSRFQETIKNQLRE